AGRPGGGRPGPGCRRPAGGGPAWRGARRGRCRCRSRPTGPGEWRRAPGALAPVPPRVPGQGEAVARIEGGDPLPGHGAGPGGGVDRRAVGPVVVEPADVAADVDGGAGDVDGGEAVAAAAVDPRRLEAGATGSGLHPGAGALVGVGEGDVEVGVEGAGGGVDAGQPAPGLSVDRGEVTGQVQLGAGQGDVLDRGFDGGVEGRVEGAGGAVELEELV